MGKKFLYKGLMEGQEKPFQNSQVARCGRHDGGYNMQEILKALLNARKDYNKRAATWSELDKSFIDKHLAFCDAMHGRINEIVGREISFSKAYIYTKKNKKNTHFK